MQKLELCQRGHGGPTHTEIIQLLEELPANEGILLRAKQAKNKTQLCEVVHEYLQIPKTKFKEIKEIQIHGAEKILQLDLDDCAEWLTKYDLGEVIGTGSYGQIIDLSNSNEWVLKTSLPQKSLNKDHGIDRDIYFLKLLKNVVFDVDHFLVPEYFNSFQCDYYLQRNENKTTWNLMTTGKEEKLTFDYLIMDKWNGSMNDRIDKQGYVTDKQLWDMFRAVSVLGHHDIIHGDAKPHNMLWKYANEEVEDNEIEIVISDFGFAGFDRKINVEPPYRPLMGWTSNVPEWDCGKGRAQIAPPRTDEKLVTRYNDASVINLIQLESYFLRKNTSLAVHDHDDNEIIGYFGGLDKLPRANPRFCPKYNDQYVHEQRHQISCKHRGDALFLLSFLDLIDPTLSFEDPHHVPHHVDFDYICDGADKENINPNLM